MGALQGTQAGRGIFITTSRFTADAISYVERVPARVVLIDGRMLAGKSALIPLADDGASHRVQVVLG